MSRSLHPALLLAAIVAAGGCARNTAPTLSPVGAQSVEVGRQLAVSLLGRDSDGDELTYVISAASLPDLTSRSHRATIVVYPEQTAALSWTPLATDIGEHELVVSVSDGQATAEQRFTVTVRVGSAAPVFRAPLGSGTTLDVRVASCFDLEVVVDDPDSAAVTLLADPPVEEGFALTTTGPLAAHFEWCPTAKQIDGAERYPLNLLAEDPEGQQTRKKYSLLIRRDLSEDCPGSLAPVIVHSPPAAFATAQDLEVTAQVSDDQAVDGAPVLYYSLSPLPDAADPDYGQLQQVLMTRQSGSPQAGEYLARVPNPVAAGPAGASATIYYFIEAADADVVASLGCPHRSRLPVASVFQTAVSFPSGGGDGVTCDDCAGDAQCASGFCVDLGGGASRCLDICSAADVACGDGGSCSALTLLSAGGLDEFACLPPGGSCQAACVDDAFEENDSLSDPALPVLTGGLQAGLQFCGSGVPLGEEDDFAFELTSPTTVTALLSFLHADGDLDLELLDGQATLLEWGYSVTDDELVSSGCLPAGRHLLRVLSLEAELSVPYSLELEIDPAGCCIDDVLESNDNAGDALPVLTDDFLFDLSICAGDQDWFAVDLAAGETVTVLVGFSQVGWDDDLDVYLYDTDGLTNLTPCCDANNGQSATDDELLSHTVTTAGTYCVVVEGYSGATNDYDIAFEIAP